MRLRTIWLVERCERFCGGRECERQLIRAADRKKDMAGQAVSLRQKVRLFLWKVATGVLCNWRRCHPVRAAVD